MNRIALRTAAFGVLALLGISPIAHAQYFASDANIDYFLNVNTVVIGYGNDHDFSNKVNGVSPTVSLVAGGETANGVNVYNSSTFNLSGGTIDFDLETYNSPTINISSGILEHGLFTSTNSNVTINMSGGFVGGDVSLVNTCTLNLSGGAVNGGIGEEQHSTVNMSGGSTGGDLVILDSSVANISGGLVGGYVASQGNGTYTTVNVSGGNVTGDNPFGPINILKFPFRTVQYYAAPESLFNFYGTGLGVTAVATNGVDLFYSMSGALADGSDLTGRILEVDTSSDTVFTLNDITPSTPEPGTLALMGALAMVGAGVLKGRRKRQILWLPGKASHTSTKT